MNIPYMKHLGKGFCLKKMRIRVSDAIGFVVSTLNRI